MFAPKVAKAQTKTAASSTNSAHDRSTLVGHLSGRSPLVLQRTIGNQAVLRLIAQRGSRQTGEKADDCARGTSPLSAPPMPNIMQPKLVVGEVNDPLESEADRVADQVMRMSDPALSFTSALPQVSRQCADCEEEEKLQTKPAARQTAPSEAPASVHEVLRSPGQPLDATTRAFMEPRFGHDFGRVRVHTDAKAIESAEAVNAAAYTVGRDIVFNRNHYDPHSAPGRFLLAHELAHTLQQGQAGSMSAADRGGLQIGAPKPAEPEPNRLMRSRHTSPSAMRAKFG